MEIGRVGRVVVSAGMLCCWLTPAAAFAGEHETLPVMVTVAAAKNIRNTSRGKALVESVQDGLVRAGWEVVGKNVEGPTSEVLRQAGFKVDDGTARLGMASEAQVLVVVTTVPGDSEGRLALSAAETGTGRFLGSKTGACTKSGKEGGSWNCGELVSALAARMRVDLGVAPVAGRHTMLVFIAPPKHFDFKMHRQLLKLATFRENTLSTRSMAVFHLHSSLDRNQLGEKVADSIRRLAPDAQFTVHKPAKQYLVFSFEERK